MILSQSIFGKLNENIANLLVILFFLIPLFTILGPFFPDLFISFTVLFSLIISIKDKKKKYFEIFKKDVFVKFFIIFLIYLLLNSSINFLLNNKFFFDDFKNYFSRTLFLFRFIFYPISIVYLIRKYDLKFENKFFLIIILTILFVIIDTLIQYVFGVDLFGYVASERGAIALNRLSGPFGDELIPGSYLMRYFFIVIFMSILIFDEKYNKYLFTFFLILCLSTILVTGERAAFILTAFGIFLAFISIKKFRINIIISFLILFISAFILLLENPKLKSRVVDHTLFQLGISNNFDDNSKMFKVDLKKFIDSPYGAHWETAFKIWQDNKLLGVGVKQFRVKCSDSKYKEIKSKLRSVRCATHPHNTYMEILSETGLIGIILFLLTFFFLIKKTYILCKSKKKVRWLLIAIILFFWPIISTGSFFTNNTQIYLSFLITLIFMSEINYLDKRKFQILNEQAN